MPALLHSLPSFQLTPARGPLKKIDPLIVVLKASADANALTCLPYTPISRKTERWTVVPSGCSPSVASIRSSDVGERSPVRSNCRRQQAVVRGQCGGGREQLPAEARRTLTEPI